MSNPASLDLQSPGLLKDIRRSLQLLGRSRRRHFAALTTLQVLTGFLDLLGILLFGVVGLLAASVSQDQPPPPFLSTIQQNLGLEGVSTATMTIVLGIVTACLLLGKSAAYAYMLRLIYLFLGRAQRSVGVELGAGLLRAHPMTLEHIPRSRMSYAVFHGTYQAVTALLGSVAVIVTEVALLILIATALLIIDPLLTLAVALYFLAVAATVHRLFARRSEDAGAARARSSVLGFQRLQESLAGQREIVVGGRRTAFESRVNDSITESAGAAAQELFLGQLPKFLYEAFMVVAAVAIVAWQVASSDLASALGVLVVFLAASARLLPSLLRINAQLLSARSSAAQAQPAYEMSDLITSRHLLGLDGQTRETRERTNDRLDPSVEVSGVSFSYPGDSTPALTDINLRIPAGSLVGIAGHSGAGKSTLADVILGINPVSSGLVLIGGLEPREVAERWPGSMAYLPQDVTVLNGSVRENVLFGLSSREFPDDAIWAALGQARLEEVVRAMPDGLDAQVGDDGAKLSGGQRQRMGLARAILTEPQLIVFDEATSALDSETEMAVAEAMTGATDFSARCTRIVIAHRLATLVDSDLIVFMERGSITGVGTFDELRAHVPAFDRQAKLLGIE